MHCPLIHTHLLTNGMHKISKHQPPSVRLRIWHRDKRHVVSDASLHPEGVSQSKIGPIRLDRPVVLGVTTLTLAAQPARDRLRKVFIYCIGHGATTGVPQCSVGVVGQR